MSNAFFLGENKKHRVSVKRKQTLTSATTVPVLVAHFATVDGRNNRYMV